jgi:hypothetical protein
MPDDGSGADTQAMTAPESASSPVPAALAQERAGLNADAMLEKSILLVAHPDDEILWFSSILNRVDKVLVCFVDAPPPNQTAGAGRRRVLLEYPLKTISTLGIPEPGLFRTANWQNPLVTEFGLKVRRHASERSRRSFHELKRLLRPQLAPYRNVITHNPWGEYGHEEHVQLHHVVKSLKHELGFDFWFSNYCSNVSFRLMMQYTYSYASHYITLETNLDLADYITCLYRKNACWTWYDDWQAFRDESFLESSSLISGMRTPDRGRLSLPNLSRRPRGRGHLYPLNFMRVHFDRA